jgi:hypothetical protein
MATRVSGVSVRWGGSTASTAASGTALLEVFEATLDLQREPPVARTAKWSLDLGTVSLSAFTRDAVPDSEYGQRRLLTITAQSDTGSTTTATFTVFSADCVYLGAEVRGELNGVWRFDHSFKVMDTAGVTAPYPS